MNKKLAILLILCIAATVYFLLPNDEKQIRNNLDSLAKYCSTAREEAALVGIKKVALAAKLCQDPCDIEIESRSIARSFTKKDLTDHLLMMKRTMPDTHFSFHDTVIEFPAENSASLTSTLSLTGQIEDEHYTDAYEFDINLKKIDGDWLFSSFSVIEFMEQ